LILLLLSTLACGSFQEHPSPPVPADLAGLDPAVAELMTERLAAVALDPGDRDAWFELGMAYEANAHADLAITCYRQVLDAHPDDAKAWYRLGLASSSTGQSDEALAAWTRAAELAPQHAWTHWRLGLAQLDAGDLDAARTSLVAALKRNSSSLPARFGFARVDLQQDQAESALNLLDQLVSEAPTDARFRQLRDTARRRLGLPVEASSAAAPAPAVWLDPWASEAASSWVGFSADLARGNEALKQGRYDQALALLEPHRRARSTDAIFLTTLGTAMARTGRTEEGITALLEATIVDPQSAAPRIELAEIYHRANRLKESLQQADVACRLDPGSGRAHEVRGLVLRLRGRKEAAREAFARASRLAPERLQTRRYLGSLQFETKQYEEARATYAEVIERVPEDEKAWLGLGMSQLELGRFGEAETSLRRAEHLSPLKEWQVHVALAELERRRSAAPGP
jgi:tetratricopeptide (TPR) repeat protein